MQSVIYMLVVSISLLIFAYPLVSFLFFPNISGYLDTSNIFRYDMAIFIFVISTIIFFKFISNIKFYKENRFIICLRGFTYVITLLIAWVIDICFILQISQDENILKLLPINLPNQIFFRALGILFLLLIVCYIILCFYQAVVYVVKRIITNRIKSGDLQYKNVDIIPIQESQNITDKNIDNDIKNIDFTDTDNAASDSKNYKEGTKDAHTEAQ